MKTDSERGFDAGWTWADEIAGPLEISRLTRYAMLEDMAGTFAKKVPFTPMQQLKALPYSDPIGQLACDEPGKECRHLGFLADGGDDAPPDVGAPDESADYAAGFFEGALAVHLETSFPVFCVNM